jgi:hypothetical protein
MSDEIDPGTPLPGVSQPKTNWRAIGLTILSAVFLGISSCFGAIVFDGRALSVVFAVLFIICVLVFLCGGLWAFGLWLQKISRGD